MLFYDENTKNTLTSCHSNRLAYTPYKILYLNDIEKGNVGPLLNYDYDICI